MDFYDYEQAIQILKLVKNSDIHKISKQYQEIYQKITQEKVEENYKFE